MSANLHTVEQPGTGLHMSGFPMMLSSLNEGPASGETFEEGVSRVPRELLPAPLRSKTPGSAQKIPNQPSYCLPSEVLQAWVQAGRFDGLLLIPNAPFVFPPQQFTVSAEGANVILESHPTDQWPQILIVLTRSSDALPTVERFLARPSANTVEAEVLYTRVLYTVSELGSCFLASEVTSDNRVIGISFSVQPFSEEEQDGILYRAKLARKLSFIEHVFNDRFTIPENITPDQVRRIETLFRGITEGEFVSRGRDISVPIQASRVRLSEPPFTGIGPYTHYLGVEEAVLDHPRLLDVGPVNIKLERAVVANGRSLAPLREGRDSWVRFEVLNNLIAYRFERYSTSERHKRAQQRLSQFYFELCKQESPELAGIVLQLLTSDVIAAEAHEIGVGWLEYHNFPDRFSSQEPIMDDERGCWRVPIYIVYASGKNAPVGELLIDRKTGSIIDEPSPELMYQEGLALGEKILRAG